MLVYQPWLQLNLVLHQSLPQRRLPQALYRPLPQQEELFRLPPLQEALLRLRQVLVALKSLLLVTPPIV